MASSPSMWTHEELLNGLTNRAFFSIPEAARLLGCDDRPLRSAIKDGKVPATQIGCKWFVPTTWLTQQVNPASRAA